jgi:hypothetical protein
MPKTISPRIHDQRRHSSRHTSRQPLTTVNTPINTLRQALSSLKPGTAYDPFNDFTDPLKAYGLASSADHTNNDKRLITLLAVTHLILNNRVPPKPASSLPPCRFLALSKDSTDNTKLRPIGIGTAWRRLCSAILTCHLRDTFASLLLPEGQFGMGVRSGLDFIIHTALAQYGSSIADRLSQALPPSRACLLLDLTNCWNQVSCEAALAELHSDPRLHLLLPYFELVYQPSNRCFFHTPNGTVQSFTQEDGFPQGDPLSPALACLVILRCLRKVTSSRRPPPANASVNWATTA